MFGIPIFSLVKELPFLFELSDELFCSFGWDADALGDRNISVSVELGWQGIEETLAELGGLFGRV